MRKWLNKKFQFVLLLGSFFLMSCAVQQEKKILVVPPQSPPKTNKGVEIAEKIIAICDSVSNPSLSEEEKKTLFIDGEKALSEYFLLSEEEKEEPRLQGAVERYFLLSLQNALKTNETPTKAEEEESPKDEILNMTTFLSPDELIETLKEVEKTKEKISLGIPIPLENETVLSYIRLYESKLKNWFSSSLERGTPYLSEIKAVFQDENVPPELVYLGIVESAFKTNVRSRAGALGMWQFMEGTARKYGLKIDFWEDERLDPIKSSRASAKYLNFLYSLFEDWHLALASYNCGEGKILRYKKLHPQGDFWSLRKTKFIRKETKEYVPAILAAIIVASQPDSFGIKISEGNKNKNFAAITIDSQVDLRSLARDLNISVETLLFLNPSLKRIVTPPGSCELRVPADLYEKAENYFKEKKGKQVDYVIHTVKKGENIRTIAKKYKIEPSEISAVNLGLPTRLRPRTQILIVRNGTNLLVSNENVEKPPQSESVVEKKEDKFYIVKKGDTLAKIARENGTTVESICKANKITQKTILKIGMKLLISPN
ncbi:MAG: transglycosylase SLT domain-containing protein [Acidobacteria bacterium]|nr:transglycosylase SLT domain-containing protein [Acidobacteriota bacterium]